MKTIIGGSALGITVTDGETFFLGINEGNRYQIEAYSEFYMPVGGTIKDFYVYVNENSINDISTFTFRKNGIDTELVVSYNSKEIGMKNNLIDSFNVNVGDKITIKLVTPPVSGTQYFKIMSLSFNFTSVNTTTDTLTLIKNDDTGAEFYLDKTLNYGDAVIIWFLTIFTFYLIFKTAYNFFWKK